MTKPKVSDYLKLLTGLGEDIACPICRIGRLIQDFRHNPSVYECEVCHRRFMNFG